MKFSVDKQIFDQNHDFKVGIIVIKNLNLNRRISPVEALLRGIAAQRGREFAEKDIHDEQMVKVWDMAYGRFGISPRKFLPSIAALLKRVKDGKEIPHINPIVDLYNYFSLKYLLPIGGEDLDCLAGDLKLTYTKGGEAFRPLGSINVEEAGEGEVAYMDKGGITCRFWNHRECERTKFTNKTVNAAIMVEDLSNMHMDKFGQLIEEIAKAIDKYIGGRINTYILNEENSVIDFGIEGRKTADDSKVTKAEKIHFDELEKSKKKGLKKTKKPAKKATKKPRAGAKKAKAGQIQMELVEQEEKFSCEDESLLKLKLKDVVEFAVTQSFPKIVHPMVQIEYPGDSAHGDYACNIALRLAKDLGMKPREVAETIIPNINNELIEKVDIAGPGFINFFISRKYLEEEIEKVLKEKEKYGRLEIGSHKTIVLDYSSPNIAKPLGVHHLLSTIIGQSLCNILKNLGFETVSVNHIGDWGTQFGKLIYAYKKWGSKEQVEKDPINELLKLYIKFHEEAEKNPEIDEEGRKEFKKFEQGDQENKKLWEWFVEESMKEINKTYEKLGGIKFDKIHGESFYEDKMDDILKEGKLRRIFEKGEEGAYVVKYDEEDIAPFVVQKKDGATLYSTRDFATIKYRINEWHPIKVLYVVDIAQTMHFKQLFKGAGRFPWYHGEGEHVWFGRMHMKDGQMSTRKGNVVLLNDVIDEAIKRAEDVIEQKSHNVENKEKIAQTIGIGSVKYSILSQNRTTDIVFDWDKMLSLESNSAAYLQYTYARAKSILRKKDEVVDQTALVKDLEDASKKIELLMRLIPKFEEQIAIAGQEFKPNILCNYLYKLAQDFNSFYNSVPVLKAEKKADRDFRLKLVSAVSQIMKNGLAMLGIEVVEEM